MSSKFFGNAEQIYRYKGKLYKKLSTAKSIRTRDLNWATQWAATTGTEPPNPHSTLYTIEAGQMIFTEVYIE